MTDMHARIATWLRDQGYPLELEAAAMAREAGFEVAHGEHYHDTDENIYREIDLVLRAEKQVGRFVVEYNLAIECKSSRDKPWLIFSTPNDLRDQSDDETNWKRRLAVYSSFLADKYADDYLLRQISTGSYENLFPRVNSGDKLGYGLTQAFAQASDPPYKAMMSATKAALHRIGSANKLGLSTPFLFVAPVVVIDVPLFSVSLPPDASSLVIEQIECGSILWKQVVAKRSWIGVHVVTKPALRGFLNQCRKAADWWLAREESEMQQVFDELSKSRSGEP